MRVVQDTSAGPAVRTEKSASGSQLFLIAGYSSFGAFYLLPRADER